MQAYVEVEIHQGTVVSVLSSHCTHPNPSVLMAMLSTHPSMIQPVKQV